MGRAFMNRLIPVFNRSGVWRVGERGNVSSIRIIGSENDVPPREGDGAGKVRQASATAMQSTSVAGTTLGGDLEPLDCSANVEPALGSSIRVYAVARR